MPNRPALPRLRADIAMLYGLLRLLGHLPLRALHGLGSGLGNLIAWRRGRMWHNTRINLAMVRPDTDARSRDRLAREILRETGRSITEMAAVWGRSPASALRLVREVRGEEHFRTALAGEHGVIIAAPHLGCWELLNFWLGAHTRLAILYRPPRNPALEPLLIRARGAQAPQQVRAEGSTGVRTLYKRLAAGGVVGILPDQQPRRGEGVFAPFFGVAALTMVLLPRLARRTGASVLLAWAERLPQGTGFRLHFQPASEAIADPDLRIACGALNRGIQDCVEQAFTQYPWHYKRFKLRPTPQEPNPYRQPPGGSDTGPR